MCGFVETISRVYVVFVDETSLWWLRFLKKGFRHCYVLIAIDNKMTWLEINPMSNQTFISVYQFLEETEYVDNLKIDNKFIICEIDVFDVGLKTAPISWFSCVEVVKRIVGLHSFFTFTPYQLYKKLKVVGKKS